MQRLHDVLNVLHGPVVDRQKHVAAAEPRPSGRRVVRDFGGHDSLRAQCPEHAVFRFIERRPRNDVCDTQGQKGSHHHDRKDGVRPSNPGTLDGQPG